MCRIILLALLSLLRLSGKVIQLLNEHAGPSLVFTSDFLVFVLVKTTLLVLPHTACRNVSFVSTLFATADTVYIAKLISISISSAFAPRKLFVVVVLVRVNNLKIVALADFFTVFFVKGASLCGRLIIHSVMDSRSLDSLLSALLCVLKFALIVRTTKVKIVFLDVRNAVNVSVRRRLTFSTFRSVSTFYGTKFSALRKGLNGRLMLRGRGLLCVAVSFLIVLKNVNFPVLMGLCRAISCRDGHLCRHCIGGGGEAVHGVRLCGLGAHVMLVVATVLLIANAITVIIFR